MRDNAQAMETEPFALFVGKNAIFAILIVGFSYLLASNKGLPNVLIIMGVLILLYTFATTRMTIGRRIYAMGGNRLAAQLSGVRTERLTLLTFVNMGVLAGLAGLIVAARLNSATPGAGNSFRTRCDSLHASSEASRPRGGVGKVMGVVHRRVLHGRDEQRHVDSGHSGIFWRRVVKGVDARGRLSTWQVHRRARINGGRV